jgi:rod shape determining protein RodA
MFDRRLLINFDFFLLITAIVITCFGALNLYSICTSSWQNSSVYFFKQMYWIALGLLVLIFVLPLNYLNLIRHAYYLHAVSLVFMVIVIAIGKTTLGSQRWLTIGSISIQPSELAKITFILALCKFYTENSSVSPYKLRDILFPIILLLATFFLIYIQPDLGTAGLIVLIFVSLLIFVRIERRSLYLIGAVSAIGLPLFWFLLRDYQKKRILTFLNPELDPLRAGYQIIQSKIAIGSGCLLGKGFTLGTQSQLRFLPEQHTDFAFSVWGEEWGFIGCALLLFLFFIMLYRGLSIAFNSKNIAGSFLAVSVIIIFFWQITINLGMTVGLFPVVGVPLPLFSYGGSSMLSSMIGIGLLLNIGMRKFKY